MRPPKRTSSSTDAQFEPTKAVLDSGPNPSVINPTPGLSAHISEPERAQAKIKVSQVRWRMPMGSSLHGSGQPESSGLQWLASVKQNITSQKNAQPAPEVSVQIKVGSSAAAEFRKRNAEKMFELSVDLLSVAGLDGRFKIVNPAFARVLGFSETQFLEIPFIDFVHPEDRAGTVAEVEKLSRKNSAVYFENRYNCVDGSWMWFAWTFQISIEEGLLYCTGHDITQRKQAENTLRLGNKLFKTSTDCMIVAGFDGYFRRVNPAVEKLLGRDEAELLSIPYIELLHPADRTATVKGITRLINHLGDEKYFENRCRAANGSYRLLAWSAVVDKKEKLLYAVARDVTVSRVEQELAATWRARGQVAHEINNPLEAAQNLLYLLNREPNLRPSGRKFVHMASQQLQRVALLTKQFTYGGAHARRRTASE